MSAGVVRGASVGRCAAVVGCAALLAVAGCGRKAAVRVDEGVDLGLARLMADGGHAAAIEDPGPADPARDEGEYGELAAQAVDAAMAALENLPPTSPTADVRPGREPVVISLNDAMASADPGQPAGGITPTSQVSPEVEPAAPVTVSERDELLARLEESLNAELAAESEPFRSAITLLALAAAKGDDPRAVLGEGTVASNMLSPSERERALVLADLLGALLSPDNSTAQERTVVLDELTRKLSQHLGVSIPTAKLCTRVRGFGNYDPFGSTTFLAGRPVRAIVYAEVDRFEHRPMDTESLGGLQTEDRWSIEVSQELKLTHRGETATLAWRMPAEKVVQTSRNKLRDFYLVTEIALPPTLSIGEYDLKVSVRDEVSGSLAERVIPIKIVADPALAWQGN